MGYPNFRDSINIYFFVLVDVPEDKRTQQEKLRTFIMCINNKIEDLNMTIKKAVDEEFRYSKSPHFGFLIHNFKRGGVPKIRPF